jgi:hypothetical protein
VNEVIPVKSNIWISAAFLDSAARTASIQEAVSAMSEFFSSALFRRYSLVPSYYNGKECNLCLALCGPYL